MIWTDVSPKKIYGCIKKTTEHWTSYKLKTFLCQTVKGIKRQTTDWEITFASHVSDK